MIKLMEVEGEERENVEVNSVEDGKINVVQELFQVMETVGSFVSFRRTQRKESLNLVRRLKLLVPLLEEIKDLCSSISDEAFSSVLNLRKALLSARKLLKQCNYGSKIYLVSGLFSFSLDLIFTITFFFPLLFANVVHPF